LTHEIVSLVINISYGAVLWENVSLGVLETGKNQGLNQGKGRAGQMLERLKELLASQKLAVLATHQEGQPYCSLMAFAATADLKEVVFATRRATRKYANMAEDPRVALLVDNRSHQESDFHQALAVTVLGRVQEVAAGEKPGFMKIYLAKHPDLADFITSPDCALMKLTVATYLVVTRFQEVSEIKMPEPPGNLT
jgi:uncharacterized protein YhbP (UPF0306 family)